MQIQTSNIIFENFISPLKILPESSYYVARLKS